MNQESQGSITKSIKEEQSTSNQKEEKKINMSAAKKDGDGRPPTVVRGKQDSDTSSKAYGNDHAKRLQNIFHGHHGQSEQAVEGANAATLRTAGTSDKIGDSSNSHSVKMSVGNMTTVPSNSGAQMPPRDPRTSHPVHRNRPLTSGGVAS